MRSEAEIRRRIKDWREARARFFPPLYVGRTSFDEIASEVRELVDEDNHFTKDEATIRSRMEALRCQPRPDEARANTLDHATAELRWVLGEDQEGALRKVVWTVLVMQLHDAECTMRRDDRDILLEGFGCPFDPDASRAFRFWVRFKDAEFEDDRHEWDPVSRKLTDRPLQRPIETIWILYPDTVEAGFALVAQDDTLSGVLRFSCKDYDFLLWDHSERGRPPRGSGG